MMYFNPQEQRINQYYKNIQCNMLTEVMHLFSINFA